jgi:hypothetical protein
MLDALKVWGEVRTLEPTRSSPSLIGGSFVTVILLIFERLVALAKSLSSNEIVPPFNVAFAIAFSFAIVSSALERLLLACFSLSQEKRHGTTKSKTQIIAVNLFKVLLIFKLINSS